MIQLNFDRHVITWAGQLKSGFWEDLKPHMLSLVQSLLEASLEGERDQLVLADWNQKAPSRRADYRNGYYSRSWDTELGTIVNLHVPRTRRAARSRALLKRYKASQSSTHRALLNLFLAGVSTRRVGEVVKPFLGRTYSASFVSGLTKQLDPQVRAFHQRPLEDAYRYLFLDGIVLKGRRALGAKKRLILVAYGIRADGRRELIGFLVERNESQEAWQRLLQDLYQRGLLGQALRLIITDGGKGLHAALDMVYPRTPRQRCWVHKLRNVANKLKRAIQTQCLSEAKGIYRANTRREALKRFQRWAAHWRSEAPQAVRCLEKDLDQLLTFLACPKEHHTKIRTTNAIERIFREVRRRTRPMSCFTNDASIERILFGLFSYFNQRWQRQRALKPSPSLTPSVLAA